ncbi:hypothetical protein HP459_20385 [Enterobacter sp. CM29]|uniref:hypothetical protein n=1 Tax=Enterobacter sp. CM29 TaxID=2738449 RepID=UPI0015C56C5D|nr:hypothetical protein [Enterobacter sp. CM29]NQD63736.1 hypothetical protein [Enterobacter sp. CM29]
MTNSTPVITATHHTDSRYDYDLEAYLKKSINGKAAMLEMLIHNLFDKYVINLPAEHRQGWGMMELSNGSFYLFPFGNQVFTVKIGNFSITMDSHQLGMSLTFTIIEALAEKTRDHQFVQLMHNLELFIVNEDRHDRADGIKTYLKLLRQV